MNKWQKVALAASTAVLSLVMVSENPAQAVSFGFNFAGRGQGSLSFKNTPLTGLTGFGEESISIDDLYNLAEDISFQFSFPTYIGQSGEYADYGDSGGLIGGTFNFLNGRLIGMNFTAGFAIDFDYYGGSRAGSVSETQTLFVRDDRFTELDEYTTSGGGFNYCDDTYYYDKETEEDYYSYVCYSDGYKDSRSYEIQEEGISFQGSSLFTQISQYYVPALDYSFEEINNFPDSYSYFIRFDELPQITFTTLEPITPSEPIPEPITVLGTSTAIAFGLGFKKAKKTKN